MREELKIAGQLRKLAPRFDVIVMGFSDKQVNYKMPSNKLDALLDYFLSQPADVLEIDSFDFGALDRSAEFFSTEARLKTQQAARARLIQLFEVAKDVAEIERLEAKLERVQGLIDGYESTLYDIKLRSGRVDVKIILE